MRSLGVAVTLAVTTMVCACEGERPPPAATPAPAIEADREMLRAVGTGAMTPLVRLLADAWARTVEGGSGPALRVEPSVGSAGGVRAAADGAVDLGLVSRPLRESERALRLIEVPIARDAVVIAAHRDVPIDDIDAETLCALYAGGRSSFSDGSTAVVLLRDREESANDALESVVPALRPLREEAERSHRLRVLYHDDAMAAALASTPGGLGVFDLGAVVSARLPLKVLGLGGVRPSVETLADGRWKVVRTLAFVVRRDRLARVRGFLRFVAGADGARIARDGGYLATPQPEVP